MTWGAGSRIAAIAVFGMAFGWVEAAVVVYLRRIYYPDGFAFPLRAIETPLLVVELVREAATLAMLASVAWLAGRRFWERFAYFLLAFGVWDLIYYVGLRVALGWPAGLGDWDILFLLPAPWVAPVYAPASVAVLMVVFGVLLARDAAAERSSSPDVWCWLLSFGGVGALLASFLGDPAAGLGRSLPRPYPVWLLLAGDALLVAAGWRQLVLGRRAGRATRASDGRAPRRAPELALVFRGWQRYLPVALMVVIVTLLHYQTSVHIHGAHGIYRRLYYFPIIIAAFLGGWPAALATALAVCAVYIPHAFGLIGRDPAPTLEKVLEMVLYVCVALLAGVLVTREERIRRTLAATAHGLQAALTEKAAVEAQLVREARLAAVGRLSAGLAHEIRNPLASIKGAAEILTDDLPAGHPKNRLLRVLVEEAARLNAVLTRFLAFARPQPGRRERVDLAAELGHVVDLVRHREGAAQLVVDETATAPALVEGDRDQIRQLLLNVLLNALEAAGPSGTVNVAIARERDCVICRVADDGPGMSRDALENLGAPFFTTKPGGTGLGLAICHRIMEDHCGRLTAANQPGGGALVGLEFPALG